MKALIPRRSLFDIVIFATGFVVCLMLAWHLNFKDGKPLPGRGVFGSDRSIYYVYLPATFIYGWDVNKFPHQCDTLYRGFILDYASGKIVNKMTCGVAVLWTPFFLLTHAVAKSFDLQPDGFSDFYQKMALVPPVFFLLLGMFFLRRFLEYYYPVHITYLCILFLFAGTNLYYYSLVEGLMSHVHSFFLFTLFLFLLKKFLDTGKRSFPMLTGIFLVASLAILVRPTNMVILAWLFLLDARSIKEICSRVRFFIRPKILIPFLFIGFMVFLPQFIYWKYVSGSFLHYSYGAERFMNWREPVILPLWFSPLNGLFLYNPLVLLFVAGFVMMIFHRKMNGMLLLLTFALISYISGAWHMWYFGGSYGSRPFVEYYAVLSLGFGYFLVKAERIQNLFVRSVIFLSLVIFSYYNLRLANLSYWYTGSVWAWDDFRTRLDRAGVIHFSKDTYTYIQDFENISFEPALVQNNVRSHHGKLSAMVDSRYRYCSVFNQDVTGILDQGVSRIITTLWITPVYSGNADVELVVSIEDERHYPWFSKKMPAGQYLVTPGKWSEVKLACAVPSWLNEPGYRLNIYLHNLSRTTFFVDDIRIEFE